MNSLQNQKEIVSICVYCYGIVSDYICWDCKEYDGVMTVASAEKYLKEDLTDYLN
jgi:hypothetical protein